MISRPSVTLIIPVYNGQAFLDTSIQKILDWRGSQTQEIEICFVNDGSTDTTAQILKNIANHPNIVLINLEKNTGKGAALRAGFAAAGGEILAFTDADLPYGLEAITRMAETLKKDSLAFIYGSRAHAQSVVQQGYGPVRRLGRVFFSSSVRLFLPIASADTQCGIKMFSRPLAEAVVKLSVLNRFAFDMELFLIAKINSFPSAPFPVSLTHRSESSVHIVLDTLRMLIDIIRLRIRLLQGKYKIFK